MKTIKEMLQSKVLLAFIISTLALIIIDSILSII